MCYVMGFDSIINFACTQPKDCSISNSFFDNTQSMDEKKDHPLQVPRLGIPHLPAWFSFLLNSIHVDLRRKKEATSERSGKNKTSTKAHTTPLVVNYLIFRMTNLNWNEELFLFL